MTDLELDEILELLKDEEPPKQIPQGAIKWFEKESRCQWGSKYHRCHSGTYIRVYGIPYCQKHALIRANDVINDLKMRLKEVTGDNDGIDDDSGETRSSTAA